MTEQPTDIVPAPLPDSPKPPQMSAKLRNAIDVLVSEGRTQREAAAHAGMHEKSLSRALKRPDVARYVEEQKTLLIRGTQGLREHGEAIAIRTAIQLMRESKSDSVRMRAVEFFAGERVKQGNIAVQVNVDKGGYDYVRPGVEVVRIDKDAAWAPPEQDQADADPES